MRSEEKPEITVDPLIGGWRIRQLARGHRFSTDDLVTAIGMDQDRLDGSDNLLGVGDEALVFQVTASAGREQQYQAGAHMIFVD